MLLHYKWFIHFHLIWLKIYLYFIWLNIQMWFFHKRFINFHTTSYDSFSHDFLYDSFIFYIWFSHNSLIYLFYFHMWFFKHLIYFHIKFQTIHLFSPDVYKIHSFTLFFSIQFISTCFFLHDCFTWFNYFHILPIWFPFNMISPPNDSFHSISVPTVSWSGSQWIRSLSWDYWA